MTRAARFTGRSETPRTGLPENFCCVVFINASLLRIGSSRHVARVSIDDGQSGRKRCGWFKRALHRGGEDTKTLQRVQSDNSDSICRRLLRVRPYAVLESLRQTHSIPRIDAPFVGISQRITSLFRLQLDCATALGQHLVRCMHADPEACASKTAKSLMNSKHAKVKVESITHANHHIYQIRRSSK